MKLRGEILNGPEGNESCKIEVSEPAGQITLFCVCPSFRTIDAKPEDIVGKEQPPCEGCGRKWTVRRVEDY